MTPDAPTPLTAANAVEAAPLPRLGHRLEYAGFRFAFALFAALPREIALRFGAWLGELFYLFDARDRRIAMLNLSVAFPEKSVNERRGILRASCRNLGRVVAEFCHLPELTAENLSSIVTFADRPAWEHVIASAAERGAVILTAHFGNWELLAYLHGLLGHPITLVHRPMHNLRFDDAITAVRTKAGTRAIKKKAAAKEAIRALRRHDILVIPSDQNQTHNFGVFVDFFGKPASTTPGAARLSMLTGAPVFPAFLVRQGESGHHRIVTLPEVEMVRTDDRNADVITNTQRCSLVVEEMIRRYPEQWIWFHKRWKTRPKGDPIFYPQ